MEAVVVASEQFRPSPLVAVFDFGYEEVERQVKSRGTIINRTALERSLSARHQRRAGQAGAQYELARHHRVGYAVYRAVRHGVGHHPARSSDLGQQGSDQPARGGPGIAEALVATAVGLGAAIPAAIFYNYFGHLIREVGARMDDFALEFLNLAERNFGEQ